MICPAGKPFCPFALTLLGAGWFLVALFVGETELLSLLPATAAQVTVFTLTAGLLLLFWKSRSFRSWVDQLPLKYLILLHLTRFVGVYFLLLHHRGELSGRFALSAGWGDIIVASTAMILLLCPTALNSPRAVHIWNTLGLIDILLAVATAAGLSFGDRDSMSALTRLPLSFLPTMLVPLIISSHIVIFLRLIRRPQQVLEVRQQEAIASC